AESRRARAGGGGESSLEGGVDGRETGERDQHRNVAGDAIPRSVHVADQLARRGCVRGEVEGELESDDEEQESLAIDVLPNPEEERAERRDPDERLRRAGG